MNRYYSLHSDTYISYKQL